MSTYKIYILDTTKTESFGEVYKKLILDGLKRFPQKEPLEIFLDTPKIKSSDQEEESAEKIISCNYFFFLFDSVSKKQPDQLLFAKKLNKTICYVNIYMRSLHKETTATSFEDYLKSFEQKKEVKTFCPHCGKKLSHDVKFCPLCGSKFSSENKSPLPAESPCYDIPPSVSHGHENHYSRERASRAPMASSMPASASKENVPPKKPLAIIITVILTIVLLGAGIKLLGKYFVFGLMAIIALVIAGLLIYLLVLIIEEKKSNHLKKTPPVRVIPDPPKETGGIFISYAHKNQKEFVRQLASYLRANNYRSWFDDKLNESGGSSYNETIASQILASKVFLPMIDEAYVNSKFCREEFFFALNNLDYILPVMVENTKLTPGMEMRLSADIHCLNYYELESKVFYSSLLSSLKNAANS